MRRSARRLSARPSEGVDCLVVGAGVVGLAVARALALKGREVLVCEKEGSIGQGNTSRNSEVIHAGLYYTPGSLKARLCVQGREDVYRYCSERGIAHRRCGKLIVASSPAQLPALKELHETARACGVRDVRVVSTEEAKELEPEVLCTQALLSPSTGIVDSHGLILSLQGDAENNGAVLSFQSTVRSAEALPDRGILVSTDDMDLTCRSLVNCAGLNAVELAGRVRGTRAESVPEAFFAKGNYFRYAGPPPFKRLVYPLPEPRQAGLGVHATIDLAGQVRFGPDVEWVSREAEQAEAGGGGNDGRTWEFSEFNFDVDPSRASWFYEAIRRYWPGVEETKLVPDYSGIRTKLQGPAPRSPHQPQPQIQSRSKSQDVGSELRRARTKGGAADFMIQGSDVHGVPGLVNLLGIESPGLTSALAIADHVATLLEKDSNRRLG